MAGVTDLVRILVAPLVWLAAFSAVYGLHGLLCGHGIAGSIGGLPLPRVLLVAAYGLTILLQAALLAALHAPAFSSKSPFVTFVSRAGGWVGLVSTVWSLLPVLTTSSCR